MPKGYRPIDSSIIVLNGPKFCSIMLTLECVWIGRGKEGDRITY